MIGHLFKSALGKSNFLVIFNPRLESNLLKSLNPLNFLISKLIIFAMLLAVYFHCKPVQDNFQDLGIGGDFQLVSADNPEWRLSNNLKDINFIFFGYTACPDFCPMTLTKFKKLNQLLGENKSRVQYIFISLDDKRDLPANLKLYMNFYVDNGIGLTGDTDNIKAVLNLYKGSFEIKDNAINHSTYTYLVDKNLKTKYLFKHADPPEKFLEIINFLL